jgi:hypothetical protein
MKLMFNHLSQRSLSRYWWSWWQLQDPDFQETVKRNIMTTADTVQKTGFAGYQAIGKQVSARTGVQLPGTTTTAGGLGSMGALGSPKAERHESDYDDFWAENGIKDVDVKNSDKTESASFAGQTMSSSSTTAAKMNLKGNAKDDEWENW